MEKRARVQGFNVDLLSFDDVVKKAFNAAELGQNMHIVTINPEIILAAKKNPKLAEIINEAELVTPDGVGVKIALKFKGIEQEQVTGVNLSKKFLELCAQRGIKIALVGAKKGILSRATEKIKEKYPQINLAYAHDGYFAEFAPVAEGVISSGAKFCLCAMGSPKQEYFIFELKKHAAGIVMAGVGGTFDVISGAVKQAPAFYRKIGFEWLYRTVKQPERLKRIFPALPIFFFQSIIESIKK